VCLNDSERSTISLHDMKVRCGFTDHYAALQLRDFGPVYERAVIGCYGKVNAADAKKKVASASTPAVAKKPAARGRAARVEGASRARKQYLAFMSPNHTPRQR
jgi:hypothetical protein